MVVVAVTRYWSQSNNAAAHVSLVRMWYWINKARPVNWRALQWNSSKTIWMKWRCGYWKQERCWEIPKVKVHSGICCLQVHLYKKYDGRFSFSCTIITSRQHVKDAIILHSLRSVSGYRCDSWCCFSLIMHPLLVRQTTKGSIFFIRLPAGFPCQVYAIALKEHLPTDISYQMTMSTTSNKQQCSYPWKPVSFMSSSSGSRPLRWAFPSTLHLWVDHISDIHLFGVISIYSIVGRFSFQHMSLVLGLYQQQAADNDYILLDGTGHLQFRYGFVLSAVPCLERAVSNVYIHRSWSYHSQFDFGWISLQQDIRTLIIFRLWLSATASNYGISYLTFVSFPGGSSHQRCCRCNGNSVF